MDTDKGFSVVEVKNQGARYLAANILACDEDILFPKHLTQGGEVFFTGFKDAFGVKELAASRYFTDHFFFIGSHAKHFM